MNTDPRQTIDHAPMSLLQIFIIAIMVGLNAMDGIDVLSISLAAPSIAREWNLGELGLGFVMSMELIGIGIGSMALGWVADIIGRRKTMLVCLILMALGMFMVTLSANITQLSIWRVVTGLGIGGLLAAITALTAEFSNLKNRALCISIMAIGYPIGGFMGSHIAGKLLLSYDWRSIFYFGTATTVFFIPLAYFVVPESVHWLVRKQPEGALDTVNHTLNRIGHSAIEVLPEIAPEVRKKSYSDLFSPGLRHITIFITAAYSLQIFTYYFILKWVPKVIVNMGFSPTDGANMLMFANIGGTLGGIVFGLLTLRVDLKKLTMATLALSAVLIALLGKMTTLSHFAMIVAFCGFFGNAGVIGMYALFPVAFPTHVRASGTGFTIGLGRAGALLSPIVVGFLFHQGLSLPMVTMLVSIGAFIAAGVLVFLKLGKTPVD